MAEEDNKALDKYIGIRIRDRRKQLNLTQSELAAILDISHQQVQRYESGENTLTLPRLFDISNILNVPLHYFYEAAPLNKAKTDRPDILARTQNRTLRLMLIEDNTNDALLFRKAVEKSATAAEVAVLHHPEKAMDCLTRPEDNGMSRPDIVILDLNMPRMDGMTLLKKIKSDKKLQSIPVLIMTNSIRSKDMVDAYALNANGFIQKSSDLTEFYEDVERILQYWSKTVLLPG